MALEQEEAAIAQALGAAIAQALGATGAQAFGAAHRARKASYFLMIGQNSSKVAKASFDLDSYTDSALYLIACTMVECEAEPEIATY